MTAGVLARLAAVERSVSADVDLDAEAADHGALLWHVPAGMRGYESHDPASGVWRLTVVGGAAPTAVEVVGWTPAEGLPAPGVDAPGNTVRYRPRGAALDLLSADDDEICISGPGGTGKTLAALFRLHVSSLRTPDVQSLIVRQTHLSLTSTTLATYRRYVAGLALASGAVRWYGGSGESPPAYMFANGSTMIVGGLDKPDKFMSAELDVIFCDEATETLKDAFEKLVSRLRGVALPNRQILLGCNPAQPTHWIKARCDSSTMRMLHSRHRDNPAYVNDDGTYTPAGRDYIEGKLGRLTGVRRLRLLGGKWAAGEGAVFDNFDPAIHVIDPFPIPDHWSRFFAVDFGYVHAFAWQDWREDDDGRLYLVREILWTQRTVAEHAVHILGAVADEDPRNPGRWIWRERKPRYMVCDHDAEGRVVLSSKIGVGSTAAKKGVVDGIQAVQDRLKPAGDGKPRLFLFRNAVVARDPELIEARRPTCTEEEIPGYVWQMPGASSAVQRPKEAPLKQDDDGCLVAGTPVSTARGQVPIEHVQAGDLVWTRVGLRPVVAAGMTSPDAEVWRVELSSGGAIEGTGNHPIWVAGQGWQRVDALRYADRLTTWEDVPLGVSSLSGSAGSSTGAIRTPRAGLAASTSGPASGTSRSTVLADSTRRSGRRRTARFPKATRSTIKITTAATILLRILNAYLSMNTVSATVPNRRRGPAARKTELTLRESGHLPRSGIDPKRGAPGTANTRRDLASVWRNQKTDPARNAARHSSPGHPTGMIDSVRTIASPRGDAQAKSTTNNAHAHSADRSSPSTAIRRNDAAGTSVLAVYATGERRPVFNLTVAGQPEFFASGVLVHNCDAMRYMCAEREIGPPRIRGF